MSQALRRTNLNHEEMAVCGDSGQIEIQNVPGEVAVMVRFGGQVSVFRAIIPQGLLLKRRHGKDVH